MGKLIAKFEPNLREGVQGAFSKSLERLSSGNLGIEPDYFLEVLNFPRIVWRSLRIWSTPFFGGIVRAVWREYKLDLLLVTLEEIAIKITFLIFVGILLSTMYAMAVGKVSGEIINELFSIANAIVVR